MSSCCSTSHFRVSAYAARPVGIDDNAEAPWPPLRRGGLDGRALDVDFELVVDFFVERAGIK